MDQGLAQRRVLAAGLVAQPLGGQQHGPGAAGGNGEAQAVQILVGPLGGRNLVLHGHGAQHGSAVFVGTPGHGGGAQAADHRVLGPAAAGMVLAGAAEHVGAGGQPQIHAEFPHFPADGGAHGGHQLQIPGAGQKAGRREGGAVLVARNLLVLVPDIPGQQQAVGPGGDGHGRDPIGLPQIGGGSQGAGNRRGPEAEVQHQGPQVAVGQAGHQLIEIGEAVLHIGQGDGMIRRAAGLGRFGAAELGPGHVPAGQADGVLPGGGPFLVLAGIGEGQTGGADLRPGQIHGQHRLHHLVPHEPQGTGDHGRPGGEAYADVIVTGLQQEGRGVLGEGGQLAHGEPHGDGLQLAGIQNLGPGEALEHIFGLGQPPLGPGGVDLHHLAHGPGLAGVGHGGRHHHIGAVHGHAHGLQLRLAVGQTVAEVVEQLRAEGVEVAVAAVDVGRLVGLDEVRPPPWPALGQVAQEHGFAGQQLCQGRAALLTGHAHIDHGAAQLRHRGGLHVARRVEHQHHPVKGGGDGPEHGLLVVVDDGIVGLLRPGQHHDGGGIVLRQLLQGQGLPGEVPAGVVQPPIAVFVGQQPVGGHQGGGAQAVQDGHGPVGLKFSAAQGGVQLAHAEHGHRQLLRPGRPQRQGVVHVFQQHHAAGGSPLGHQHMFRHPGRIFHDAFSLAFSFYHITGG